MSKHKIIFSKNNFVSFAASILMIIDRYLIIFMHLSIITKIALYIILSRLFDDKSIMKFIKVFFMTLQIQTKNLILDKIYDEKL